MDAVLICYTQKKATQTQRTALVRELYGYKDFSDKGRYTYQREGILSRMPHLKPHKAVLIARKRDKTKLLKILKKHKAKVNYYDIQIEHPELA